MLSLFRTPFEVDTAHGSLPITRCLSAAGRLQTPHINAPSSRECLQRLRSQPFLPETAKLHYKRWEDSNQLARMPKRRSNIAESVPPAPLKDGFSRLPKGHGRDLDPPRSTVLSAVPRSTARLSFRIQIFAGWCRHCPSFRWQKGSLHSASWYTDSDDALSPCRL